MEDEDEDDDDDDDGSNSSSICLLKRCSSSVRCLLVHPLLVTSLGIYLVRLRHLFALSVSHSFNLLALLDAKFKSDLLLIIFLLLLLNCICFFLTLDLIVREMSGKLT